MAARCTNGDYDNHCPRNVYDESDRLVRCYMKEMKESWLAFDAVRHEFVRDTSPH
jgi:hypothetical protein